MIFEPNKKRMYISLWTLSYNFFLLITASPWLSFFFSFCALGRFFFNIFLMYLPKRCWVSEGNYMINIFEIVPISISKMLTFRGRLAFYKIEKHFSTTLTPSPNLLRYSALYTSGHSISVIAEVICLWLQKTWLTNGNASFSKPGHVQALTHIESIW